MGKAFLSHADAARLNRNIVLHYVKDRQPVSRTDIWDSMSISRASVTQVIRQLQESDWIVEAEECESNGGRRPRNLRFNDNARFAYVFDWNRHRICLANMGGEILESRTLSFPQSCTPAAFSAIVSDGIQALRVARPVDPDRLLGLGLALPGLIDSRNTTVLFSVELGWRDVDIRRLFSESFGRNVFLERTGNVIALGEYVSGAAKGFEHVLLVLMGNEGIGASAVVHGDCQHGSNYMYGELGHIKLCASRVICSCGQQGCLEATVRDHLMRNGGQFDAQLIEYLSFGVSTAVNLSDPGIVLLAGRLVQGLDSKSEQALLTSIRGKITNERSRSMILHLCGDNADMGVKGMCAHIFNNWFSVK